MSCSCATAAWSISPAPAKPAGTASQAPSSAGLKSRGVKLAVETIVPIATADFPTKAKRPGNSRLDLSRLKDRFGVTTPAWQEALLPELDDFVALQREQADH